MAKVSFKRVIERSVIFLILAIIIGMVWTVRSEKLSLDSQCTPSGMVAKVNSLIKEKSFWAEQLILIDERIFYLENIPKVKKESYLKNNRLSATNKIFDIQIKIGIKLTSELRHRKFYIDWNSKMLKAWVKLMSSANDENKFNKRIAEIETLLTSIYNHYPSLKPSQEEITISNLRKAADTIEQQLQIKNISERIDTGRIQKIDSLKSCRQIILRKQ